MYEAGKLYVGTTMTGYFVGSYNAEKNALEKVWGARDDKMRNKVVMVPGNHPMFLISKFDSKNMLRMDVSVNHFLHMVKVDDLEKGEEIAREYNNVLINTLETLGLIDGSICIGSTLNQWFIGKLDLSSKTLKKVLKIDSNKDNSGVELGQVAMTSFMELKNNNRLRDVDISIDRFYHMVSADAIFLGKDLASAYNEASSGIFIDDDVTQADIDNAGADISERLRNAIKNAPKMKA